MPRHADLLTAAAKTPGAIPAAAPRRPSTRCSRPNARARPACRRRRAIRSSRRRRGRPGHRVVARNRHRRCQSSGEPVARAGVVHVSIRFGWTERSIFALPCARHPGRSGSSHFVARSLRSRALTNRETHRVAWNRATTRRHFSPTRVVSRLPSHEIDDMRTRFSHELIGAAGRAAFVLSLCALPAMSQTDPRVGLRAGWWDAQQAARGMELLGSGKKAEGFYNPSNPGDFGFLNGDLAFKGNIIVQGGFHGFQVWDISDSHNPRLRSTFVCPGGQGDPTLYRNLLFFSVEETRGRVDCGGGGRAGHGEQGAIPRRAHLRRHGRRSSEAGRRGADVPRVAHAHARRRSERHEERLHLRLRYGRCALAERARRLLASPARTGQEHVAVPNRRDSGAARPSAGREGREQPAHLRRRGRATSPVCGRAARTARARRTRTSTNQCHDITTYSAIGMAAGACSGNGLLLDIRDVVQPEAARRGRGSELRVLAFGDVQQRRQEGAVQRRVGRRHAAASAARRTTRSGAPTRSSRSRTAR